MRIPCFVPAAFFVLLLPPAWAQSPVLLIEPTSPLVASLKDKGTEELHLTYFPQSSGAQIKNPEQLVLKVAINSPWFRNNTRSVPFTRRGLNAWEATLTRGEKDFWLYLIFLVKDDSTGQVDDNGGRYWDVVFCLQDG